METTENGLRTYKRYAEMKRGTAFKFYEVVVQETDAELNRAIFTARYGRIGQEGRTQTKLVNSLYSTCVREANDLFSTKLGKGYKEVSALEALASAMSGPEERLEEASAPTLAVPSFRTGSHSTDRRLEKLAQDKLDKLRLIYEDKSVYYKTDYDYERFYKDAGEVLRSLSRGYANVKRTKAHGKFCDDRTDSVMLGFLRELNEVYCRSQFYPSLMGLG